MHRKTMILFPAALLGVLPYAASAETLDQSALEMFRSASVTIQQAGNAALQAHVGTLAAIAFSDENGRAAYEAVVIGNDGLPWTVLVDAANGEAFASAPSSAMEDHPASAPGMDDEDHDGEVDDG